MRDSTEELNREALMGTVDRDRELVVHMVEDIGTAAETVGTAVVAADTAAVRPIGLHMVEGALTGMWHLGMEEVV